MESVTIFTVSYRFIYVFDCDLANTGQEVSGSITFGKTFYKGLQEKAAPKSFKTMRIVWQNSEFWKLNLL